MVKEEFPILSKDVNNKPLVYLDNASTTQKPASVIDEIQEYYVEQDYYFAVGDNRDDSLDSRFWGFVPRNHIIGEALFAYFSLDISSFPYIPRFDRIGTIIQ